MGASPHVLVRRAILQAVREHRECFVAVLLTLSTLNAPLRVSLNGAVMQHHAFPNPRLLCTYLVAMTYPQDDTQTVPKREC
jgi:hypothetical protein